MKLPWEMFFSKEHSGRICRTGQFELPVTSYGLFVSQDRSSPWCPQGKRQALPGLRPPSGSSGLQPVVPLGWGLDVSKAPKARVRYE